MSDQQSLVEEIDALLAGVDAVSEDHKADIDAVAPTHFVGAHNLLHYAYLRSLDNRRLQAELTALGATRLSTVEPSVKPRLKAARNVIGALSGEGTVFPSEDIANAFADADEILEEHTLTLLGESDENTPSRIMVTLPSEAADDYEMVLGFAQAGMDLARINCAHDGQDAWKRMIDNVHRAAEEVGRDIRVNMDLAGPKIRTGAIAPGPQVGRARVTRDDAGQVLTPSKLWLTAAESEEPVDIPELPGRPALPLKVERRWLENIHVDSIISLHDARGSRRTFTVVDKSERGVLAEGDRNAYISEGTLLECDYDRTRATGIPPVERRLEIHSGQNIILTSASVETQIEPGVTPKISCTLTEAIDAIQVGQPVLFDDGIIEGVVEEKRPTDDGHTEVVLKVTRAREGGVKLAAHKGINLPDTDLPLASLTPEDEENLKFVARYGDIAAISFVRTKEDVLHVLEVLDQIAQEFEQESPELGERVRNLGLVLKIETVPAFQNIPSILLAGMRHANFGIMIARGDLAVELGFERMAEVPQQILALAEAAHVPVILGTQVLENMAKNGLPSRAEITDAAFALRSECVMLNKGPHIEEAIRVLTKLSLKLGRSQRKNRMLLRRIRSWDEN